MGTCRFLSRSSLALGFFLLFSALAGEATLPPLNSLRRVSAEEQAKLVAEFEKSREGLTSFQASFIETMRWKAFTDETKTEGRLAYLPPNQFRFERTSPSTSLTVSDGKKLWMYYPEFKEAEEFALDTKEKLGEITDAINVAMGFNKAREGTAPFETVMYVGEGLYVLELAPREKKLKTLFAKVRIWLDHSWVAQQTEIISNNGDHTTMRFVNPKRNEPISAETFVFTPPPGVSVSRPLDKK